VTGHEVSESPIMLILKLVNANINNMHLQTSKLREKISVCMYPIKIFRSLHLREAYATSRVQENCKEKVASIFRVE
jgi:hypothetical protein